MTPAHNAPKARACWAMRLLAAKAALLLGACAQPALQPPAATDTAAPSSAAAPAPAPTLPPSVTAFERQQRLAALAAAAQGRWIDAGLAWDVLLALHPGDTDLLQLRTRALDSAQHEGNERLQRARQALLRGDGDTASRLYLEALALLPGNSTAADALRALERERVKRQHLGSLARNSLARGAGSSPLVGAETRAANGLENIDLEHASLLAAQGEIDAAIALLLPHVAKPGSDRSLRRLLADLYFRKAEKLAPAQPAAAVAALRQSLVHDTSQEKVTGLLNQLRDREQRTVLRKPTRPAAP